MINYSLQDLMRTIKSHKGPAPSNRAVAFFSNPSSSILTIRSALTQLGIKEIEKYDDPRELAFLCTDVTLPSSNIMTQEYRELRHTKAVAHSLMMNDVNMSFIVTNDHFAIRFFRAWQNAILNKTSYRLNYHDEYARDIIIVTFDTCNVPTAMYKVMGAFPTNISEIAITNTNVNELLKVSVTFKYDDFIDSIAEVDYEMLAQEAMRGDYKSASSFFKNKVKDTVGEKLSSFLNLPIV